MSKLSIVVPVYYNELNLRPLYQDIKAKIIDVIDFEYEIVMVDDGSGDNSWQVIQELATQDKNIRPIRLSRNFGSHAAILCGLVHAGGDCAVIKAADLQEPTELILQMYQEWRQGYNVVLAVREIREDKSFFSELYYWLTRKVALPKMPAHGFDVFLVDRKVIQVLKNLDEPNSAITGQILWSGFKTKEIYYDRKEREIGKSKWTLTKKIRLVADTLFSFSTVPITAITWVGTLSCIGSAFWALLVLISKLSNGIEVAGFTTLFIFQLFSFGIIMLTLGVLGNYLWRTFDASRGRPVYIVEEDNSQDKSHAER
jgi:glycosyltransferase involved in cell wall biosynthesis